MGRRDGEGHGDAVIRRLRSGTAEVKDQLSDTDRPKTQRAPGQRVVFYSWQSDSPNATNRGLIETALKKAASGIANDDSVAVEPVIDRDTSGVPGAPDISATIFQKIRDADAFVADVSIVSEGPPRPTPNPNVLVELGYAIGVLGWERVILVINTECGAIEDLPFDLRSKRCLTYRSAPDDSDRATPRRALAKELDRALRLVLEATEAPTKTDESPRKYSIDIGPIEVPPSIPLTNGGVIGEVDMLEDGNRTPVKWKVVGDGFAYLVVAPIEPLKKLTQADVKRLLSTGTAPLSYLSNHRFNERHETTNRLGGAVFEALGGEAQTTAMYVALLSVSGGVTGLNGHVLFDSNRQRCMGVSQIEEAFEMGLSNYLAFFAAHFGKPTLRVTAGFEGVAGSHLMMPTSRMSDDPCHEPSIGYQFVVDDYEAPVEELLAPFFRHVWECYGEQRQA